MVSCLLLTQEQKGNYLLLSGCTVKAKKRDLNIDNYNFSFCIYGCETWSTVLREEHRLRDFEERVLKKVLGFKRDFVTGE